MIDGFNLIRIVAGEEWKTAFHTKQGLFRYTVMPFVLIKSPASVQEMIDTIFKGMEVCICHLDDLRMYSGDTEAKHQPRVEKVLQQYVKHVLTDNPLKSKFHVFETIFLAHVINS